mgnify:FL=1
MTVVQINTVYNKGSTGKIARQIQDQCMAVGIKNIVAYRYNEGGNGENTYCISTWLDCHAHNRIARYTHRAGFYSKIRTALFLHYLDKVRPDIIHLHNLHGSYINIPILFKYIKRHQIKVIWTFHDCWPFTGYCPYYLIYKCEEWRNGCQRCLCENSLFNYHSAKRNLYVKMKLTKGLDLTVVTPSRWLAEIVKQSFYSKYNVLSISNGIDTEVFRPRESDFRKKYGISEDRFVLLGVASVWEERKGLKEFNELAKRLDSRKYQIVLVGTDDTADRQLQSNIISIHRTENQIQLAEIYTAADLFVNPTKDEVLGMVNIEANACGTPVVTYASGGSPECIDEKSGIVVACDDIDAMEKTITQIYDTRPFSKEDCIACASRFDMHKKYREYIDLYQSIADQR